MTISKLDEDTFQYEKREPFRDPIAQVIDPVTSQFDRIVKSYFYFHVIFATVIAIEIILLLIFFSTILQSSILALAFAALFLTIFSFFTLRFYLQAKKGEQLKDLKDRYIAACKSLINYRDGAIEAHLTIANSCSKLAKQLQNIDGHLYELPNWLLSFSYSFDKFSRRFHWHDFYSLREALLSAAVEEHIKIVKCEPTSMEAHANLANVYVMLSGLYGDHRKRETTEEDSGIPPAAFIAELERKFRFTAERAVEELKILNDYAPNDPWVHAQLAYSYHDLQMPVEEMREYETMIKLRPEDKETLVKLGILYFEQGLNAKGLRVYEELRRSNYKKAEALIKHYGAYQVG